MFARNAFSLDTLFAVTSSTESSMEFLRGVGIQTSYSFCSDCDKMMSEVIDHSRLDGRVFRCSGCRSTRSIRHDRFLDESKLTLNQFIGFVYLWSNKNTREQMRTFLNLGGKIITKYAELIRGVCSWQLARSDIRVGGFGREVQVDESVFYRAKYHRGHALFAPPKWVIGLYDVDMKMGVIQFVKDRSADTLLPIIHNLVLPGSIIHTD